MCGQGNTQTLSIPLVRLTCHHIGHDLIIEAVLNMSTAVAFVTIWIAMLMTNPDLDMPHMQPQDRLRWVMGRSGQRLLTVIDPPTLQQLMDMDGSTGFPGLDDPPHEMPLAGQHDAIMAPRSGATHGTGDPEGPHAPQKLKTRCHVLYFCNQRLPSPCKVASCSRAVAVLLSPQHPEVGGNRLVSLFPAAI